MFQGKSEGSNECNGVDYFEKVQYYSQTESVGNYTLNYELGVIKNKILLEVELGLSSMKKNTERETTTLLDMLGDVGGFQGALDLLFYMLAEYFAAKFFLQAMASALYMRRKTPEEMEQEEYEGGNPEKITDRAKKPP